MGTYVKGMETPTWCGECEFLSGLIMSDDEYHCYAPISNKNNSINVTDNVENWSRPDWCPLVGVTEPHGDLIDRDEVRNDVFCHLGIKGEENLLPAEKSIFGNLIKAKAVIEAEGECE